MISEMILAAALVGGSGMGLQISPAEVTGQPASQAQFLYKDAGSTIESVRVQAVELRPVTVKGKHGWAPYGEADYATVTPEHFTIKPGHRQVIRVVMRSTDGKPHNVAILATANGNSHVTGGRISASVGARYVVSVSKPHSTAGLPVLPIGAGVALLAILLAAWGVFRRRSRRTSKPEPESPYGFIP